MSENPNSASTFAGVPNLGERVEKRFGIFPNFFQLAPETPEITEKLWGFGGLLSTVREESWIANGLVIIHDENSLVHAKLAQKPRSKGDYNPPRE
jgi:hypothetical protein